MGDIPDSGPGPSSGYISGSKIDDVPSMSHMTQKVLSQEDLTKSSKSSSKLSLNDHGKQRPRSSEDASDDEDSMQSKNNEVSY